MQTYKVNACCAASLHCSPYDKHFLDSCFRLSTRTRPLSFVCPPVVLALRSSSSRQNSTRCAASHMRKEASRYSHTGTAALPSPRLPLAPVSGSWIRPSSRWSVGWEVDTAFIGQAASTNHRPVSSQMPSGAPGARNPPAHAASALPHCTTTGTTACTHHWTTRLPECQITNQATRRADVCCLTALAMLRCHQHTPSHHTRTRIRTLTPHTHTLMMIGRRRVVELWFCDPAASKGNLHSRVIPRHSGGSLSVATSARLVHRSPNRPGAHLV